MDRDGTPCESRQGLTRVIVCPGRRGGSVRSRACVEEHRARRGAGQRDMCQLLARRPEALHLAGISRHLVLAFGGVARVAAYSP
jgi:hypothetical protein